MSPTRTLFIGIDGRIYFLKETKSNLEYVKCDKAIEPCYRSSNTKRRYGAHYLHLIYDNGDAAEFGESTLRVLHSNATKN